MNNPPILAYCTVELQGVNPLLIDRRGQIATLPNPEVFPRFSIEPDEVRLLHPARYLSVSTSGSYIFCAGEEGTLEAIDLLFEILTIAEMRVIDSLKLTAFFAAPVVEEQFEDLVKRHVAAIQFSSVIPRLPGRIDDIGVIYSYVAGDGRLLNFQYGPMGRTQWVDHGGPRMAAIESTLPLNAWAAGIYDRVDHPMGKSPKDVRRAVISSIDSWRQVVSESIPDESVSKVGL